LTIHNLFVGLRPEAPKEIQCNLDGDIDILRKAAVDQMAARDRRADQAGQIVADAAIAVARHPRFGGEGKPS
jgi:hypothetical protein